MRFVPIALCCCAVLLSPAVTSTAQADVERVTPELTVFTAEQTATEDGRPAVLRGSATRRGTVDNSLGAIAEPSLFALGVGDNLWLTDPASGELVVCSERRTSRVGGRFIGCLADRLPIATAE